MNAGTRNLIMPGNPRYQPESLQPYFGYDNLYIGLAEVEIAVLRVLAEIGVIPQEEINLLAPETIARIVAITTTEVDEVERAITKHDVRAWVKIAQGILDPRLARWLHVLLTSYDVLDTGRILQFSRAHVQVVRPKTKSVIRLLTELVRQYADQLQIGRTHGQAALPITVGFWLATILSRILYNAEELDRQADCLVGKISGAVGAYNAQMGLGIADRCGNKSFEERVLEKLGLSPAPISTQILPPEPLAYYLHACVLLSGSLGQLGRDCRHLMRTEISEVAEAFATGQVGSSTMAHKRNPVTFENLEGTATKIITEFLKVLLALISEHQRDLTGSCVSRDFPIIVINLVQQLDTLLRQDKNDTPFLSRMIINRTACETNFQAVAHLIVAEPLYIALQMAGYPGDAHELVNRQLVPAAQASGSSVVEVFSEAAGQDPALAEAWERIPTEVQKLLHHPERYTGLAREKALAIADQAERFAVN